MKIHEYQAKAILKKYNVGVPKGVICINSEESVNAARIIGGDVWVVKAQIHAGGRGKGGGIKVAKSLDEVKKYATEILGMKLKTKQTIETGQKVKSVLVEEGLEIKKEIYISLVTDRVAQKVTLMASSQGGMDIEEVVEKDPKLIFKLEIDYEKDFNQKEIDIISKNIGIEDFLIPTARKVFQNLFRAYWETDASLIEINPFVVTKNNNLIALDAKFSFDSNALFRQPEIVGLRDFDEEDQLEIEASKYDLAYISLKGNIGCLVNGAGLAMATMDCIKLFNGEPANFLDVGGGASEEKVTEAFKIMLKSQNIKAILVNIFGGIMKCDVIAKGIINASKNVSLNVPIVVRMKGTNENLGKQLLSDSDISIISADTMDEAAKKVVAIAMKH
tara:strand:- start:67 stop:1233 length:1167 start_codon:yes stop_codon:yes gene_type:complete